MLFSFSLIQQNLRVLKFPFQLQSNLPTRHFLLLLLLLFSFSQFILILIFIPLIIINHALFPSPQSHLFNFPFPLHLLLTTISHCIFSFHFPIFLSLSLSTSSTTTSTTTTTTYIIFIKHLNSKRKQNKKLERIQSNLMGSLPSELSLDLRPSFVPKTITDFLSTLPTTTPDKLSLLNDFLARLEDEFRKIDAFKRELPLSMLLLNDAILALKEESEKCMSHKSQPVLEEFIPLKKECDQDEENNDKDKECRDKKNWMSSVQLWNTTTTTTNNAYDQKQHRHKLDNKKNEDERQSVAEDPFQSCSNRNEGGKGFMLFSTYTNIPVTTVALPPTKEEKEDSAVNRLSLLTPPPAVKNLREGRGSSGSITNSNRALSSSPPTAQPSLRTSFQQQQQQQAARKQRRCWSPELHRRFVNALQKLGGSQAATPKQIRELMQVDGLTNDEVKSHLQKYRLHTRRAPSATTNQSMVVLGGLWMSQDQYNDSSKGSSSGSGSPQSPLHLAAGSRGGTDSMEDDEDAKSESYSWKSHIHNKPGKVDVV